MDKGPDAFRTISEVADDLDVPQHVLRFWETRFSQIKPMKRGGGRRYYRPGDVDLLRGIKHLLYGEGYTIKGVQRILKEEGPRFVQSAWPQDDEETATERPATPGHVQPAPLPPEPVAVKAPPVGIERRRFSATFVADENDDGQADDGRMPERIRAQLFEILSDLKACRTLLAETQSAE